MTREKSPLMAKNVFILAFSGIQVVIAEKLTLAHLLLCKQLQSQGQTYTPPTT